MKEYQKIETLFKFDNEIKGYKEEFYNPIVEYLKDCKWIGTEKNRWNKYSGAMERT